MKIVVVDGNPADREAAVGVISSLNETGRCICEVAGTAADGKAGYRLISETRPDLILMDMQLTRMKGLSMLKRVREDQIASRVIVLTEDRDFKAAQQAISLGVDDYLLKPVRKARLEKAVLTIAEKLEKEQARERALSAESIFMGCLNGQIHPDRAIHEMTKERYGFTLEEPGAVFLVWLGSGYTEQREKVRGLLERMDLGNEYLVCILPADMWHALVVAVCLTGEQEGAEEKGTDNAGLEDASVSLRDRTVPALSQAVQGELVCMWGQAEQMMDFPELLRTLRRLCEWNLVFDRGRLIREQDVQDLTIFPLKYPADLEAQARQAVLAENREDIRKCYYRLYDLFWEQPHSPQEMKECLIRFNMAVLAAYKTRNEVQSELRVQDSMSGIREAMSWNQIREAMDLFFQALEPEPADGPENEALSSMIRKALQLVQKYYDQGITLEEIAGQIFVSEEYLSSQFKKETGLGFKETVTQLRMERIKSLLVNTGLKLNQIAELTGYTDPKYMSRVFKEETGMLPNEFRKAAR